MNIPRGSTYHSFTSITSTDCDEKMDTCQQRKRKKKEVFKEENRVPQTDPAKR